MMYGLKNKLTDSIIIPAKYIKITDNLNDTNFIVQVSEYEFGVINLTGEMLVPLLEGFYSFNKTDSQIDYGSILAYPPCIDGKINKLVYVVDKNGKCLVKDYYPCPNDLVDSTIILPKQHQYIQKAEKYKELDIHKAVGYYKKAIENDSLNSATYFSAVYLLMSDVNCYLYGKGCEKYKEYFQFFEYCINKGLEIEKDKHYQIAFNRYKKSFYKYCIDNKKEVKIAKKEINLLRKQIKHEDEYWKW